jgi:hypothetical protein
MMMQQMMAQQEQVQQQQPQGQEAPTEEMMTRTKQWLDLKSERTLRKFQKAGDSILNMQDA